MTHKRFQVQLSNFKLHLWIEIVGFDVVLVKSLIETIDAHVSTLPLLMTCEPPVGSKGGTWKSESAATKRSTS